VKTAISIDDKLLLEADRAAQVRGLSRSGLFALAVADFLERQRQTQMLLKLNEVYGNEAPADETRLLTGIKAKVRRNLKDRW
jgi:hypothetical protein